MFTYKDYLNERCTYRQYYGQFVNDYTIHMVKTMIGANRILASTDPHFNDIPYQWWDHVPIGSRPAELMMQCGDHISKTAKICICKEAAQQIREAAGITKQVAMLLPKRQRLFHVTEKNADGSRKHCWVNGKCKTWQDKPAEFRLPVRRGLREYFYITLENAADWRLPETP